MHTHNSVDAQKKAALSGNKAKVVKSSKVRKIKLKVHLFFMTT